MCIRDSFAFPTYLINVSRGAVQVENDIIRAIEEGKLTGAFLDVFQKEPLPNNSPLWQNPKIKITANNVINCGSILLGLIFHNQIVRYYKKRARKI